MVIMQIQYVHTLFGAVGFMLVVQFNHFSGFHSPVSFAAPQAVIQELQHCLVLTLNASMTAVSLGSGLVCRPFLGQKFDERQWALVSDAAKLKLMEPDRQTMASDLTNNQSVSIFANHAAMWAQVAAAEQTFLILEDDAILTPDAAFVLNQLLRKMRHEHNYVLKLWNSAQFTKPEMISTFISTWLLNWWQPWYTVGGYTVMLCVCENAVRTASTAAYVLDAQAARTMFNSSKNISQHVDAYMHRLGCIEKQINFSVVSPALATLSGRASQHIAAPSWAHWQRHFNEMAYNYEHMNC